MNIEESKDFLVSTASLKEVRVFSREVFEKLKLEQDLKDELVLAIAEAAQNILDVTLTKDSSHTGRFYDWANEEIPW